MIYRSNDDICLLLFWRCWVESSSRILFDIAFNRYNCWCRKTLFLWSWQERDERFYRCLIIRRIYVDQSFVNSMHQKNVFVSSSSCHDIRLFVSSDDIWIYQQTLFVFAWVALWSFDCLNRSLRSQFVFVLSIYSSVSCVMSTTLSHLLVLIHNLDVEIRSRDLI